MSEATLRLVCFWIGGIISDISPSPAPNDISVNNLVFTHAIGPCCVSSVLYWQITWRPWPKGRINDPMALSSTNKTSQNYLYWLSAVVLNIGVGIGPVLRYSEWVHP